MIWQDVINGSFEFLGAPFILLSIIKLHRAKKVHGISCFHVGFFVAWGYWNLYYYPFLCQWASFIGGVAVVILNTFWLYQIIYYSLIRPK